MGLSNAVPKLGKKGLTRMEEREQRKSQAAKAWDDCCADVDARDRRVCRVSGVVLEAWHTNPRKQLARHHMRPKSTAPSEKYNPANVITVSQWVHDQIHKKAALHLEGNANLQDADGKFCGVLLSQNTEFGWREVRTL